MKRAPVPEPKPVDPLAYVGPLIAAILECPPETREAVLSASHLGLLKSGNLAAADELMRRRPQLVPPPKKEKPPVVKPKAAVQQKTKAPFRRKLPPNFTARG